MHDGPDRGVRSVTDLLSPMEAVMWRVGQDATLRMTVGAVLVLDKPPERAALEARLAQAMDGTPRLRRRPDPGTMYRGRLRWVDEPDPSPEAHARWVSIGAPGTMRQILDLVSLLEPVPFDPERSPWDVTVITGLEDGRAALYLRAHHVLTDGFGGLRLLGLLLDERHWPQADTTPHPAVSPPTETAPAEAPAAEAPARPVGTVTITIDLGRTVRRVLDRVNAARDVAPVELAVGGAQRALDVASSVSRQMLVTGGPLAEWPAGRSLSSRFEVFAVDDARDAAVALGGSRNDLLVAAAAAGLGRYHERVGTPAAELRLVTPTAQRRADGLGGNWFAPARLEVPTAVGRPGPQFGIVAERLAQARREPALRVASTVAAALGRLPTPMLIPALHAQADSVDFAATAVPGLREERRICGCLVQAGYPFGPRLGCPMNITAFGNADRLDVGIALDPAAFADPGMLVDCLGEAFANYRAAAGDGPTTRKA
jgi:diacylglycerol O-acyltransferase / wax synthase